MFLGITPSGPNAEDRRRLQKIAEIYWSLVIAHHFFSRFEIVKCGKPLAIDGSFHHTETLGGTSR